MKLLQSVQAPIAYNNLGMGLVSLGLKGDIPL